MSGDLVSLESLLRGRQAQILGTWRELILATYPEPTARFLDAVRDPFRDPIGHRLHEATEALLEGIVQGRPFHDLDEALDRVLRVRAVQAQPPSQALDFVFLLKRACRQGLSDVLDERARTALDARLDGLACRAFDVYMRCREEIHEIRVRDVRRRVATMYERLTEGTVTP